MPRGKVSKDGDTHTAANGYHYTRHNGKWRLTHHIVAEEFLGRKLSSTEMVRFKDGNRQNFRDPSNLVIVHKRESVAAKKARLEARIMELQAQLEILNHTF